MLRNRIRQLMAVMMSLTLVLLIGPLQASADSATAGVGAPTDVIFILDHASTMKTGDPDRQAVEAICLTADLLGKLNADCRVAALCPAGEGRQYEVTEFYNAADARDFKQRMQDVLYDNESPDLSPCFDYLRSIVQYSHRNTLVIVLTNARFPVTDALTQSASDLLSAAEEADVSLHISSLVFDAEHSADAAWLVTQAQATGGSCTLLSPVTAYKAGMTPESRIEARREIRGNMTDAVTSLVGTVMPIGVTKLERTVFGDRPAFVIPVTSDHTGSYLVLTQSEKYMKAEEIELRDQDDTLRRWNNSDGGDFTIFTFPAQEGSFPESYALCGISRPARGSWLVRYPAGAAYTATLITAGLHTVNAEVPAGQILAPQTLELHAWLSIGYENEEDLTYLRARTATAELRDLTSGTLLQSQTLTLTGTEYVGSMDILGPGDYTLAVTVSSGTEAVSSVPAAFTAVDDWDNLTVEQVTNGSVIAQGDLPTLTTRDPLQITASLTGALGAVEDAAFLSGLTANCQIKDADGGLVAEVPLTAQETGFTGTLAAGSLPQGLYTLSTTVARGDQVLPRQSRSLQVQVFNETVLLPEPIAAAEPLYSFPANLSSVRLRISEQPGVTYNRAFPLQAELADPAFRSVSVRIEENEDGSTDTIVIRGGTRPSQDEPYLIPVKVWYSDTDAVTGYIAVQVRDGRIPALIVLAVLIVLAAAAASVIWRAMSKFGHAKLSMYVVVPKEKLPAIGGRRLSDQVLELPAGRHSVTLSDLLKENAKAAAVLMPAIEVLGRSGRLGELTLIAKHDGTLRLKDAKGAQTVMDPGKTAAVDDGWLKLTYTK